MDRSDGKRNYEADKIVLLGLFALGLLIARFITSARYTGPLNTGRELIRQLRQKGLPELLENRGWEAFFLIRNEADNVIGFTMDFFSSGTDEESDEQSKKAQVAGARVLYIRGRRGQEHLMLFRSDDSFERFWWRSQTLGWTSKRGAEITLDKAGELTVTTFDRQTTRQTYKPAEPFVPDVLFEFVYSQMYHSNLKQIIVETLSSDGQIIEVAISRVPAEDSGPLRQGHSYQLKADFLDGRGFYEKVSFDSSGAISGILLHQNEDYLFERTTAEVVTNLFPERADYILHQNSLLEQSL